MSKRSFVYRHLSIYRFIMNLLYFGKYKKRFILVSKELRDLPVNSKVLELCFGDTHIARYCKMAGYRWKGIDLNEQFVSHARKKGYDAHCEDLSKLDKFPESDICIMMGSLYHFHGKVLHLLRKMLEASDTIIISEPVLNLSNLPGIAGFIAKRLANAGKGNETFRYNKSALMTMLEKNSAELNYCITSVQDHGKDLLIKLIRNGSN